MRRSARLTVYLILCSCTGGSSDNQTPPAPLPPPPPPNCIATLQWVAPTEREDGSPLAPEEIKKFSVLVSRDLNGNYVVGIFDINDPFVRLWEIREMPSGTLYFRINVTDIEGLISDWSNVGSKTFDERCP